MTSRGSQWFSCWISVSAWISAPGLPRYFSMMPAIRSLPSILSSLL